MKTILIILAALLPATALAGNQETINRRVSADTVKGYGAIADLTGDVFNAGVWTGWIAPGNDLAVCFEIAFTRSAATGVTMRCESSDDASIADDAGYDVHSQGISAGTATSNIMTYTYTVSASNKWIWCVDMDIISHKYMQCLFDDVADNGGANDLLTVTAKGITP